MKRRYLCSSYTICGVLPGGPVASRHTLRARLAACAAAGYQGMWLHWRDYLQFRRNGGDAALRDLYEAHGLLGCGVEYLSGWEMRTEAGREAERLCFAAARAIGARTVNVGASLVPGRVPPAQLETRFHALCARAADHGLSIALEFVPWTDIADLATALRLTRPPNAGLAIDCWHLFRAGVSLTELAQVPADKVYCVQINDATARPHAALPQDTLRRLPCGAGAFDLAGFASALDDASIAQPLTVEIISEQLAALPPKTAAERSFRAARSTFA